LESCFFARGQICADFFVNVIFWREQRAKRGQKKDGAGKKRAKKKDGAGKKQAKKGLISTAHY